MNYKDLLTDEVKEAFRKGDLVLLFMCLALNVFGILMIGSTTNQMGPARYLIVQSVAAALGVLMYVLVSSIVSAVAVCIRSVLEYVCALNSVGSSTNGAVLPMLFGVVSINCEVVGNASGISASTVGIASVVKDVLCLCVCCSALTLVPVVCIVVFGNNVAMRYLGAFRTAGANAPMVALIICGNGVSVSNLGICRTASALVPMERAIVIRNTEIMSYASYVTAGAIGIAITVKCVRRLSICRSASTLTPVMSRIVP